MMSIDRFRFTFPTEEGDGEEGVKEGEREGTRMDVCGDSPTNAVSRPEAVGDNTHRHLPISHFTPTSIPVPTPMPIPVPVLPYFQWDPRSTKCRLSRPVGSVPGNSSTPREGSVHGSV